MNASNYGDPVGIANDEAVIQRAVRRILLESSEYTERLLVGTYKTRQKNALFFCSKLLISIHSRPNLSRKPSGLNVRSTMPRTRWGNTTSRKAWPHTKTQVFESLANWPCAATRSRLWLTVTRPIKVPQRIPMILRTWLCWEHKNIVGRPRTNFRKRKGSGTDEDY